MQRTVSENEHRQHALVKDRRDKRAEVDLGSNGSFSEAFATARIREREMRRKGWKE